MYRAERSEVVPVWQVLEETKDPQQHGVFI